MIFFFIIQTAFLLGLFSGELNFRGALEGILHFKVGCVWQ